MSNYIILYLYCKPEIKQSVLQFYWMNILFLIKTGVLHKVYRGEPVKIIICIQNWMFCI